MFKINQKGFTLIEIVGAVTIFALLTVITLGMIIQYLDWSRKKAFDTMAKSASNAAEQYIMDFPHASVSEEDADSDVGYEGGITFEELSDLGYLSNVKDPMGGGICRGRVVIGYIEADASNKRALDKYMYVVHECCPNFQAKYIYTYKTVTYIDHGVEKEELKPVESISKNGVICR